MYLPSLSTGASDQAFVCTHSRTQPGWSGPPSSLASSEVTKPGLSRGEIS